MFSLAGSYGQRNLVKVAVGFSPNFCVPRAPQLRGDHWAGEGQQKSAEMEFLSQTGGSERGI